MTGRRGGELTLEGLTVRYGHGRAATTAVQGIDLAIPAGRVIGLVGESGSGKSSIARSVVGLTEPAAGRILLDRVDVAHGRGRIARLRHQIQMIFQDPYSSLDPHLTIGQSIDEALLAANRRGATGTDFRRPQQRRAEVARLLEQVNLDPGRSRSLPSTLSGGQRQRVALARALAAAPRVLIADEITSSLDVSVQGAVLNLLTELQRELGLTVLFISHNLAVVRHVCEDVAVLNRGRLVESGPVTEVLEQPQHPYTRQLLASVPQLGVRLFTDSDADFDTDTDADPGPGGSADRSAARLDRALGQPSS